MPVSVWRYYLISTRPETADAMFSWADCVRVCCILPMDRQLTTQQITSNNNVLLNK